MRVNNSFSFSPCRKPSKKLQVMQGLPAYCLCCKQHNLCRCTKRADQQPAIAVTDLLRQLESPPQPLAAVGPIHFLSRPRKNSATSAVAPSVWRTRSSTLGIEGKHLSVQRWANITQERYIQPSTHREEVDQIVIKPTSLLLWFTS